MLTEQASELPAGTAKDRYHSEREEDRHSLSLVFNADRVLQSEDAACYIAEMVESLQSLAASAHMQLLANLLQVAHEEARLNCADLSCHCHHQGRQR
jgi:hypothetical protein